MHNSIKTLYQKGFKLLIETYLEFLSEHTEKNAFRTEVGDFFISIHIQKIKEILHKKKMPKHFAPML